MINRDIIFNLQKTDIENADINSLINIRDVSVDRSMPPGDRLERYLSDIKNPYCFRCDDMVVKLEFAEENITLQDRLENYLKINKP